MPGEDELKKLIADPAMSYWFKDALTEALKRDPVDAANDADLLALVLDKRAKELLDEAGTRIDIQKA